MFTIIELRGKETTAEPGSCGYDAEATVIGPDGKKVFVHVNLFGGEKGFSVYDKSVFDYLTGNADAPEATLLEDYEGADEMTGSKYRKVFELLYEMAEAMAKGLG